MCGLTVSDLEVKEQDGWFAAIFVIVVVQTVYST